MFIERLCLTNFRCFGPDALTINLTSGLTAFVGVNGAGKTAVMQALQRLFGITGDHRRLRRQDFHVPAAELVAPPQRAFVLEAILAFPELDAGAAAAGAIPEFFQQMAADEVGRLKCRLRLEATWTDDGSLEGTIEQKYWAVRTFGPFMEADCIELKAIDRARIQMIYVPASRDGASQVTAFQHASSLALALERPNSLRSEPPISLRQDYAQRPIASWRSPSKATRRTTLQLACESAVHRTWQTALRRLPSTPLPKVWSIDS